MPRRIHRCHLPTCNRYCPAKHLLCKRHWAMVPENLKREVYRTVNKRDRGSVNASWAPWWRAQAEATAEVLNMEGKISDAVIKKQLDRAHEFADSLEEMK